MPKELKNSVIYGNNLKSMIALLNVEHAIPVQRTASLVDELTDNVIKFNINGEDFPAFISVIPAIIDLDAAQELDRKKMAQKLLKIIKN